MKIYSFIVTAIALILAWLLFDQSTTNNRNSRILESEIRSHRNAADSLSRYGDKVRDSLNIAFETIRFLNGEKEKAHQESKVWQSKFNYEKGMRLGILTDAKYDSALSSLYPQ